MTARTKISFGQALTEALRMEMHRDPGVVCLKAGSGSAVLDELEAGFGPERVIRVEPQVRPVSVAAGLAMRGRRVVCEVRAAELGPDLLAPLGELGNEGTVVVRIPDGGRELRRRSVALEGRLLDTAGTRVAAAATPADAKGLLCAAIRTGGPTCLLEPEALYDSVGDVEEGGWLVAAGAATLTTFGSRISIAAYGVGAWLASRAAALAKLDAEVIDLRSLRPLDAATLVASVGRTGKIAVIEPEGSTHVSGEIARVLLSEAFEYLDGPLERIELPVDAGDTDLADQSATRIAAKINDLIAY